MENHFQIFRIARRGEKSDLLDRHENPSAWLELYWIMKHASEAVP